MKREGWGGVKLKEKKVFTLAYTNDIVLLAEEEDGIRAMISRLEEYTSKKKLKVNARKLKIMRFGNRRRKKEKMVMGE